MKPLLFPLFLLSAFAALAQQDANVRFIEVSGNAFRKVQGDKYFFSVTKLPGETCQIPKKGRDWEKQLKDCKEENDKLITSHLNALNTLVNSYGGRVVPTGEGNSYKYGNQSKEYSYMTTSFADYADLMGKLKEIENAFVVEMQIGQNSGSTQIMEELTLEALENGRKKAEKMVSVLGLKLGAAHQIYENQPIYSNNDDIFKQIVMGEMSKRKPESLDYTGTTGIPDSEGFLYFSKSVFIRFYMRD